jgi:glutathione S-transferase
MTRPFNLYGAHWSLYTAKTRSFLRCKGIFYQEIESSKEIYDAIVKPHVGREVVPTMMTPENEFLQDSTEINDILEARFAEPAFVPSTPRQRLISHLLDTYGNEWLRIPALYYRWSFPAENEDFLMNEFGRTYVPQVHPFLQRSYGHAQSLPFRRRLAPLGITDKIAPAIEQWTEEFLKQFDDHLAVHPFLLGEKPCMADFAFIGPLYAHIYRDPHSARMMQRVSPRVVNWVERMHLPVAANAAFLPDDAIPETLFPILRQVFAEFIPVIKDASPKMAQWVKDNPGKHLPRHFGSHTYTIGGVSEQRALWSHMQWMMQRPLAYYLSQNDATRRDLDRFLQPLGGGRAFDFPGDFWLERSNYELLPNSSRKAVDVASAVNGHGPGAIRG